MGQTGRRTNYRHREPVKFLSPCLIPTIPFSCTSILHRPQASFKRRKRSFLFSFFGGRREQQTRPGDHEVNFHEQRRKKNVSNARWFLTKTEVEFLKSDMTLSTCLCILSYRIFPHSSLSCYLSLNFRAFHRLLAFGIPICLLTAS